MFGCVFAMQVLPLMICEKKEDFDDKSIVDDMEKNVNEWMKNDPQLKMVFGGNLLEMVEKGFLQM
jgi:hypothetical protein